jgi:L-ornithine Nalpha-acyltransferase
MGGSIGDGAVVDPAFNTVDVCLVLPTERLKDRYLRHLAMPPSGRAVAA